MEYQGWHLPLRYLAPDLIRDLQNGLGNQIPGLSGIHLGVTVDDLKEILVSGERFDARPWQGHWSGWREGRRDGAKHSFPSLGWSLHRRGAKDDGDDVRAISHHTAVREQSPERVSK